MISTIRGGARLLLGGVLCAGLLTTLSVHAWGAPPGSEPRPTMFVFIDAKGEHLQEAMKIVGQKYDESWAATWSGDVKAGAAAMEEAARTARTELGPRHFVTTLRESLSSGLRSVIDGPAEKQVRYIESNRVMNAGYKLLREDPKKGLAELRRAYKQRIDLLGADHILTVYPLFALSRIEGQLGEAQAAKEHAADLVRVTAKEWGKDNPGYGGTLFFQAIHERELREYEAAETHLRQALEIYAPAVREGLTEFYTHQNAQAELELAELLNDQRRYPEAEPHAQRASDAMAFDQQEHFGEFLMCQIELARSTSGQGKNTQAEATFTALLNAVRPLPPNRVTAMILARYAEHLRFVQRHAEADRVETHLRSITAKGN